MDKISLPLSAPPGARPEWPGQLDSWLGCLLPVGSPVYMVTTRNENGTDNVQLNAWIALAGRAPAELCLMVVRDSHTLQNALRTGEWVVNLPPRRLGDRIFEVVRHNEPGTDELRASGLTALPGEAVAAARVAEAVAHLECRLAWHHELAPQVALLAGQVVAASADRAVLEGTPEDRVAALDALIYLPSLFNLGAGRLEGELYTGLRPPDRQP